MCTILEFSHFPLLSVNTFLLQNINIKQLACSELNRGWEEWRSSYITFPSGASLQSDAVKFSVIQGALFGNHCFVQSLIYKEEIEIIKFCHQAVCRIRFRKQVILILKQLFCSSFLGNHFNKITVV